jgi:transposase-like protein
MLYTANFKKAMVQKLLVPGGPSVLMLSRESGVSEQSLYNWKANYQNRGSEYPDYIRNPRQWTDVDKYEASWSCPIAFV